MRKNVKIIVGAAILCVLASVIAFAVTSYPYAKVSFSGITMVSNGDTAGATQGFVDITLKKVNATSVAFCLEYDTDYLELSDVTNNSPIVVSGSSGYDAEHKYFQQNTDIFPIGAFRDDIQGLAGLPELDESVIGMPIIGIAKPQTTDYGHIMMNFTPKRSAVDTCEYIDTIEAADQELPSIMANDTDLKLGRISFNIKDPAAFSKLSSSQLEKVIKVVPYYNMVEIKSSEGDYDIEKDTGIQIMYLKDDGDFGFYARRDQNIEYSFSIISDLTSITPQVEEMKVNAYEVYRQGTIDDLFDFLNEKMSMLTMLYSNGTELPAVIEWDKEKSEVQTNIPGVNDWNPRGDRIYTIRQPYDEDGNYVIEVQVTVAPVKLTGFSVDKPDATYVYGSPNFPTEVAQLELPEQAYLNFDTYLPNFGKTSVLVSGYSLEGASENIINLPDDFADGSAHSYTLYGHLGPEVDLESTYEWLTVPSIPQIKVKRNVLPADSALPKEIKVTDSSVNNNGELTIVVENVDGSDMTSGTTFRIKLPDGDFIDTDSMGAARYQVVISGKTATITISPDISTEQKVAQMVNLGSRAGTFQIAATEPDKTEGPFAPFAPDPRRNIYLSPDYEFDYSGLDSAKFPVKASSGATVAGLPTTVTLPVPEDTIGTTYDGHTGLLPGALKTFTVDAWNVTDGDPSEVGSTVTVTGTLKDGAIYTNYGVVNNDDGVTVTIKYYVVDSEEGDSIAAIPDAVYDKQQEGYDHSKLQTKSFTITNTGPDNLQGLSVNIEWSDTSVSGAYPVAKEAFSLTKAPVQMLEKDGSETFEITTVPGLPVEEGKESSIYKAKVSVMSDNNVLQTFYVTFEVTRAPIYQIKLTIDDDEAGFGSAKTDTETYTSEADKLITIIAEPEDECEFTGWTVISPDGLVLASLTAETTTFTMPESDVEIKASFKETMAAKLRATDLIVKGSKKNTTEFDTDQTLYDVDDEGVWSSVTYDPKKREYYLAVPNNIDRVQLWFKPREEALESPEAEFSVTHEHDSTTDDITPAPALDTDDDYYKSESITLELSPVNNIVTLYMKKNDENGDPVTTQYKFNIYRKLELKDLMDFKFGNSPYGLIRNDGSLDETASWNTFVSDGYKFTGSNLPAGATAGIHYSPKAWSGENFDHNEYALFVINSSSFYDPGYDGDVLNSIGATVDSEVTKKVTVQKLTETTPSLQNGSSDDFVMVDEQEITLSSTGEITELNSLERGIRPDKYDLIYSFKDFDGSTVSLKRPIIVLYPIGDINIDKVTNSTDDKRIINRHSTDIANNYNVPSYDSGGLIFKYRICDVNKDESFNSIDANYVRFNQLEQFYVNVSEGGGG